jgi:hypothetical protein
MQGMQGVPVQMVMGPMGPMMAAGMPPGMMSPGAMAAPQLTQMLVEAARGGRSSNVFFKTRICNKCVAGWVGRVAGVVARWEAAAAGREGAVAAGTAGQGWRGSLHQSC